MIIAVLFSLAVASQPETASTRHCTGARRNEVCTAQGLATLRSELGVAAVDDEVAAGVEIYRAFYLQGGGGLPVVSFVRRPGHNPAVEVSAGGGRKMTADVPLELWTTVVREAADADREFVPMVEGGTADICLDGGAVMIEIGVPASRPRPALIRHRAVSDCAASPAIRFAGRLADLAVEELPGCAAIDPDTVPDGGVWRLSYCFTLKGDQLAAAQVRNRFLGEPVMGASPEVWRQATGLEAGTRLKWNGETFDAGAPAALISRVAVLSNFQLSLRELQGVSSHEVRTIGAANYLDGVESWYADFTQIWRYDDGAREWRLRDWSFGPFEVPPTR